MANSLASFHLTHWLGLELCQSCLPGAQALYGRCLEEEELHCYGLDSQTAPPAKQSKLVDHLRP